MSVRLALPIALVLALWAGRASADEDPKRAAKAFHEGQKAYAAGDYRRAAQSFEDAYQAKPHHDALWNAARSWQRAGEPTRAANDYAKYLDLAPAKAMDRDNATIALKELGEKLGRVELHAVSARRTRLDGAATDAALVYVAPGDHVAEADSDDGPIRKAFTVDAGRSVSVTLSPPVKDPPPDPNAGHSNDKDVAPPPEKRKPLPPVVVYIGGGLAVVAGGLATWQGLETVSRKDDFQKQPTQQTLDDARGAELRTNIAIASAAGLAVVTGALAIFLVDWKGEPQTTVGFGPNGFVVTGAF